MVIEQSIAHANDSLAVTAWIPGEAEARRDIVVVAGNSLAEAERFFRRVIHGSGWTKERLNFHVIANPVVQRQLAIDGPGILRDEAQAQIVERLICSADTL